MKNKIEKSRNENYKKKENFFVECVYYISLHTDGIMLLLRDNFLLYFT